MELFIFWYLIPVIWYISHIFDDMCDVVLYKRDINIFTKIKNHKLHYYFNLEPEWWKRKYIDRDPSKGRRKILFIIIPAMFFDAWHGGKWMRKACHSHMVFFILLPFLPLIVTKLIYILYIYIIFMLLFGVTSIVAHNQWYGKWFILPKYR